MTDSAVQRDGDHLGLVVAGYVMALVFPPGGFIAGFALAGHRTGHALAIVTLSFLVVVSVILFWLLLLASA